MHIFNLLGIIQEGGGVVSGPTYDDLIASYAPAGYWKLNEVSGTVATDSSGNGRHGTYVGGVTLSDAGLIVAGENGAHFTDPNNNTENGVTVADEATWSMSSGGTWGFWFRTPVASFFKLMLSRWDSINDGWYIWMASDNTLEVHFRNTVGGVYILQGPTDLGDDQRHSVFVTCDGAKLTKLYVDGVEVQSGTATHYPGASATGLLRFNHDFEFINATQRMARVVLIPGLALTGEQVAELHAKGIA